MSLRANPFDLAGKVALITGSTMGIGLGVARVLAQAGAHVVISSRKPEDCARVAAELTNDGLSAEGRACHIGRMEDIAAISAHLKERRGGLDILVNNAAVFAGLERRPFAEIDEAVWDKVMAVNVKGVWQMTRAAAPALRAAGGGAIVNVSSATVFSGSPQWMHYVASKGAVIAMTRSMARELGDDRIRVNVLAPGFTLTEASLAMMENARSYGVERGALKRAAEVEDIVGGALYLASPLADYVTGQTLIVDGGRQFI